MDLLKQRILEQGEVIKDTIIRVDSIINHQIDPFLMQEIAQDIYERFKDKKITKIVTIETSGIAPALLCSLLFQVPMVFLKKAKPSTMQGDIYCANVHSFTKNKDYILTGSAKYLNEKDHVLLIDDMLANGEACFGALSILKQAHATVDGIAIIIEKAFQSGRKRLEAEGYDIYSCARIQSMKDGNIVFIEE